MTIAQQYQQDFAKALAFFEQELSSIRTGRASPSLLENIRAEYYGTPTPLQQLGSISAPEPMLLVIQVWDAAAAPAVASAITKSDLGLNPLVEGMIIRIPIPSLTEERRQEMVKILKQKAEAARVSVRSVREEGMKAIKSALDEKSLSEDAAETEKKELQKLVDAANEHIETIVKSKEQDILRV